MPIDDDQKAKLDRFFSDFGPRPEFKVAIHRVEPTWCAGYIEIIDVFEQDDVSFERIKGQYGGGKFYLKIMDSNCHYIENRTINICGEPLRHGRRIDRSQMNNNPDKV